MIKCPCIDCITLSICRQKQYGQLVKDCPYPAEFVLTTEGRATNPRHRDKVRMRELHRVLKPVCWKLENSEFRSAHVVLVKYTLEGRKRDVEIQERGRDM